MTERNYHHDEAEFQDRQASDARERLARWEARPKQGEFSEEYAGILRARIARHERARDREIEQGRAEQERRDRQVDMEAEL